ncbi:MAG TPA: hypothetical protein VF618_22885 [Thermoanaerobaculia bacterium]
MKRHFLTTAAAWLFAASALAQLPSQTIPVSDFTVQVAVSGDSDNGRSVCFLYLNGQCNSMQYPLCEEFGVRSIGPSLTKHQLLGTSNNIRTYLCGGSCTAICNVRGDVDPDTSGCPIILDLGKENLDLTGAGDGVSFDIDADGVADTIAWTAADGDDAFLVADLDGDGVISSGRELFGTASPQAASSTPHGYKALAVYDTPQHGGDGDGWVTANDARFGELQAWIDRDHDGYSDSGELVSLASIGVSALGVDYTESRRRDRFGNEFRYRGWVLRTDGSRAKSYDVFFAGE